MKSTIDMAREAEIYVVRPDEFQSVCIDDLKRFEALVRADAIADERNSWPAEMEAMERQVNILTDALAQAKADEREACAKVADVLAADYGKAGLPMTFQALSATATEIRARNNT